MLKKSVFVLVMLLFAFSLSIAYAASDATMDNVKAKLQRGLMNTFTGWMEIPCQIHKGFQQGFGGQENNKVAGVVTGATEGVFAASGRTISGVVDVVGCWTLCPASNDGIGIPSEAKDPWEKGEVYDLTKPTVQKATIDPVGEKLKRGLANSLFGIAEIPGQIAKGVKEHSPDGGVLKGLWYFLSREISGISDLATLCFPTPKEVVGNTFDKDWPWTDLIQNMK